MHGLLRHFSVVDNQRLQAQADCDDGKPDVEHRPYPVDDPDSFQQDKQRLREDDDEQQT